MLYPQNVKPNMNIGIIDLSIIFPGSIKEEDLFAVPNKWVVVVSNPERESLRSVYVNDIPASKTSTISRGRAIVDFRGI